MANTNTDQIRQLENQVHLAGYLAELSEKHEGTTTNGVPYLSFSGVIQCGEDAVYSVPFRTFVKSKKSDGSDSKNFAKVQEWYDNAVPKTKDPENPTMVSCFGSITDNPYVNSQGKLVEATQFNIQSFTQFKEFQCDIDLEGFLLGTTDETRGEEQNPTGRGRLRLMSRDIFGSILEIKNIVVPADFYGELEDSGYVRGITATFYISLQPNTPTTQKRTCGIGKPRETQGRSYLEWVMTGASEIVDEDSDEAIPSTLAKKALNVRAANLKEVEERGYQGSGKSSNAGTSSNRGGLGGAKKSADTAPKKSSKKDDFVELEPDNDDFPY